MALRPRRRKKKPPKNWNEVNVQSKISWPRYDSLEELFEAHGLSYTVRGKNVSDGWVGIQCPFCGDNSNHLGVRKKDFHCYCWICGQKRFADVIKRIFKCDHHSAGALVRRLESSTKRMPIDQSGAGRRKNIELIATNANKRILPPEATSILPKAHMEYLRSRGFNPRQVARKYRLHAVDRVGKYMFRILFPIIVDGVIVNFTARDITEQQVPRYLMLSNKEAILKKSECLFNFNTIKEGSDAIMVEGPMDVMKMGDGAFCPMGARTSQKQILTIRRRKIRTLFIIPDRGKAGENWVNELSWVMASLVKRLEIVRLTNAPDPGDLSQEQVELIKNILNFNK